MRKRTSGWVGILAALLGAAVSAAVVTAYAAVPDAAPNREEVSYWWLGLCGAPAGSFVSSAS